MFEPSHVPLFTLLRAVRYVYSLFAVINHHGTMQQGHYTSYVRLAQAGEEWFKCDDETIHQATSAEVLSSEGYMLFYIKKRLEYE